MGSLVKYQKLAEGEEKWAFEKKVMNNLEHLKYEKQFMPEQVGTPLSIRIYDNIDLEEYLLI
jgi:hypothetical protein